MLSAWLLAAAAATTPPNGPALPESFRVDESVLRIELTCHLATSRFVFAGDDVVIEDLGDEDAVTERHAFTDERLLGILLDRILADSFLRDPETVESRTWFVEGDEVRSMTIEATTGCLATIELEVRDFSKRSRYEIDEAIPGRIQELLQKIHFQVANDLEVDPFEDE